VHSRGTSTARGRHPIVHSGAPIAGTDPATPTRVRRPSESGSIAHWSLAPCGPPGPWSGGTSAPGASEGYRRRCRHAGWPGTAGATPRGPDRLDTVDQLLEDRAVMAVGAGDPDREWRSPPARHDVTFRASFACSDGRYQRRAWPRSDRHTIGGVLRCRDCPAVSGFAGGPFAALWVTGGGGRWRLEPAITCATSGLTRGQRLRQGAPRSVLGDGWGVRRW
jgi:hypothetical protein